MVSMQKSKIKGTTPRREERTHIRGTARSGISSAPHFLAAGRIEQRVPMKFFPSSACAARLPPSPIGPPSSSSGSRLLPFPSLPAVKERRKKFFSS